MKIRGAVLEQAGLPRPFRRSRPLVVRELDLEGPGPGEVLIRVEAAGLCHSDLSVVNGARPRPTPMLLGHEAAGIVEAKGAGVEGLDLGDRVVATFLPRCHDCVACATNGVRPCDRGMAANAAGELLRGGRRLSRAGTTVHHHLGVSGFATHAVLDRGSVTRVERDVPPAVAAVLGCAVLTGGGAVVNAAKPQPGQRLAVVGLGGVGMAAVLSALAVGCDVVAVDPLASKRSMALEWGAHEAVSPEDAVGVVRADVVIEAAGSVPALEVAVAITDPGGTTVTVGLPHADARLSISPTSLVSDGRSIIGSYMGSSVPHRDIPVFIDHWRAGRLPLTRLVSSTLPLEDLNNGLDHLADGLGVRTLIAF